MTDNLTKGKVETMTNAELMANALWNQVRMTNEVNSRRGLTKKTAREETWYIEEILKRFDINESDFYRHFNR